MTHEAWMQQAIAEANKAEQAGDVPVGCIVVHEGQIIGRGYNQREVLQDPIAHAEVIALRDAACYLKSWRLEHCVVYVTLEPCPMCAGALVNSRIAQLVYGASDPKAGAINTLYNLGTDLRLNHRFETVAGVLASECAAQLSGFFQKLRQRT